MEQFPGEDYVVQHRATLMGLLEGAEGVAQANKPDVILRTHGDELDVAKVQGVAIGAFDPETILGVQADGAYKVAVQDMNAFRSLVVVALSMDDYEAHLADYQDQPEPTPDQQRQITERHNQGAAWQLSEANGEYTSISFADPATAGHVTIASMRLQRPDGSALARQLIITTGDDVVERVLNVWQVSDSVRVHQAVRPTDDGMSRAMVEFFVGRHRDEAALDTVTATYTAHLWSRPSVDLSEVYARYPDPEDRAVIDEFVTQLRARAVAARESAQLRLTAPELHLPTVEELAEYVELMTAAGG